MRSAGVTRRTEPKPRDLRYNDWCLTEAPFHYLIKKGAIDMTKLFAWLFAAAFAIGTVALPAVSYADQHEKDPVEEAEEGGEDDKKDGE